MENVTTTTYKERWPPNTGQFYRNYVKLLLALKQDCDC